MACISPSASIAGTLAHESGLQHVIAIQPILAHGSVNEVFRVDGLQGTLIIRLNRAHDPAHAVQAYFKEQWCLVQAAAIGIPGPQVLTVGRHHDRAYMVQTFIAGTAGSEPADPALHIWRTLGEYTARIAAIPVTGFGDQLLDPMCGVFGDRLSNPTGGLFGGAATPTWEATIDYHLASLQPDDKLIALDVYTPEQQPTIYTHFATLHQANDQIGLAHGDLHPRNTIIDPEGRIYLLDWGEAEAHVVPLYSLGHAFRRRVLGEITASQWEALVEGHRTFLPNAHLEMAAVESIALLKAFDLVRWACDRRPQRIPELAAQAQLLVHYLFR